MALVIMHLEVDVQVKPSLIGMYFILDVNGQNNAQGRAILSNM